MHYAALPSLTLLSLTLPCHVLRCAALLWSLHCTDLLFIQLPCAGLLCAVLLSCLALRCPTLPCRVARPPCAILFGFALLCLVMLFPLTSADMHCPALPCGALPFSAMRSSALFRAALPNSLPCAAQRGPVLRCPA